MQVKLTKRYSNGLNLNVRHSQMIDDTSVNGSVTGRRCTVQKQTSTTRPVDITWLAWTTLTNYRSAADSILAPVGTAQRICSSADGRLAGI
jgi:hypothetical protein